MDINGGWPPRVLRAESIPDSAAVSSDRYFTLNDRRLSLQAALAHPDVPELLQGRWEVLGSDLVCEKAVQCHVRHRVRVCLFNYTENHLVEIYVEDGRAVTVALRASHEYPEAPIEMAQAIVLARGAPELKDKVADLTAHAILQVPNNPSGLSYGHRCMWVMFTDKDDPDRELPVKYAAMVDLRLQRVLAAGPAPCASIDEPDSQVQSKGEARG